MNISKGLQTAALIAVLVAGVYVWGTCRYRTGAQEAILQQAGDTTDARLARVVAEQVEREAAWRRTESVITRQRDGFRQNLAQEKRRADSLSALPDTTVLLLQAKDAIIATQDSLIAHTERLAAFYQSQTLIYRDSLVPALNQSIRELTNQRDAWRKRQGVRRCGLGGGAGVGLRGQAGIFVGMVCRI